MRLFVAVNGPQHFLDDLATRLDAWRRELPLAWTHPSTWHLTLMFLGEWPAERLPALRVALAAEVAEHAPFTVQPGRLDAFPDLRAPRVLFLQFTPHDGGPLHALAAGVRARVESTWPAGPQDRKAFKPHLTLARIKSPLSRDQREILGRIDLGAWPAQPIVAVRLVASELQPQGARHVDQAVLPLGAAGS
jgi:RNA 2',3'-cyclic 3'-phosphodiesterase